MDSRKDQQQVLEAFQRALEEDRAKPQIGQLSDLGLVELTRRRQGQSLRELFSIKCQSCVGQGVIPQLELGPPEDRRIIAFRNRDEENRRGKSRGGAKGGNQPLKAASAFSGRVMPSRDSRDNEHGHSHGHDAHDVSDAHDEGLDHGHEFDDVPEEILAQMPEDLLDARAAGKAPGKRVNFDGDSDDFAGQADDEHETPSLNVKAPSLSDDDDDFNDEGSDQDMAADLARSVSAVESVYQEMDSHSGAHIEVDQVVEATIITNDFLEPVELHESGSESGEAFEVETIGDGGDAGYSQDSHSDDHHANSAFAHEHHEGSNGHSEHSDHSDNAAVEEVPETPIAAEVDPVTGIYRLKTRAEQEEADRQAHGHAHENSDANSESNGAWHDGGEQPAFNSDDEAAHSGGDFGQLRIPIASAASVSDSPSGDEEGDRPSTEYGGDDYRHEQE
ncbi:unnamed protein product [Rotaria sordida]|uniref:RNA-binding protein AU-1/Ribonuclease E/G domain-containing protein n=1 Tax=Rotaria sordida TaxID=392033 RepID=A0A813SW53_9BILA|nr:unnamed protein product [Rotaria sordida]